MPVAEIRNSAKDDVFVRFIIELRVYTQMSCFLFYFTYTGVFLQLV